MWNFKGILWNSTQNILPIYWKIWFLYNSEILRALRFKKELICIFEPPAPHPHPTLSPYPHYTPTPHPCLLVGVVRLGQLGLHIIVQDVVYSHLAGQDHQLRGNTCNETLSYWHQTWGLFQYSIRHVITRSYKISNPQDLCSYHFHSLWPSGAMWLHWP